jgi:hypothetical protein
MIPLVAWGARRLGVRHPTESFRPHWAALAVAVFADTEAARGVHETYQMEVGTAAFHLIVDDGRVELRDGRAERPAITLRTDDETWTDIASGAITANAATTEGRLTITGDRAARARLKAILSRRGVLDRPDHGPLLGESSGAWA